jgi:anti-anti-sigma factor
VPVPSFPQFAVQTKRYGDALYITPVGELDIATAPRLGREFENAEAGSAAIIVVDLGKLTFIHSARIHLLVAMDCACAGEQLLRLIGGSPVVDRVFDIAGVRAHLSFIARENSPVALQPGAARSTQDMQTPRTRYRGARAMSGRDNHMVAERELAVRREREKPRSRFTPGDILRCPRCG